jgi:hypothetical protein
MYRLMCLVLCSVVILATSAHAWTWNQLAAFHEHTQTTHVGGIYDAMQTYGITCAPDGVTYGQAYNVTKRYIERHPQNSHFETSVIVGLAFVDTGWLCTQQMPVKSK